MTAFSDRVQAALASGYTIERELTGGGMSHVYLATERALGRKVVVKVLPPDLAAGVNRERFRREIQLAAQLQHPHIVPLLTAGEDGDLLYYTMPYVSGESLRTRLEEKGRLPVRDVVRILTDVVDALAYAHAHGVMHRDIKPGNVLTQRSHALVTDFGVAKALSAALPLAGSTTSGMAIGTPAYMAPEQLAADPAADHRVDLYAVGLLAYELLTGEAPFSGASPAATMAAQLTRDPAPLETVREDVPQALSDIIRRCLSKEPDGRPASAEALLAELEELPRDPSTPTRSVPAARSRSLAGRFAAVAAIAAVASTVAIATFVSQRKSEADPAEPSGPRAPATTVAAPAPAASAAPSAGTPPAGLLTRADSMAIAAAVRREMARAERPRTREHDADSLSNMLERMMIDSLVRLNSLRLDERLARIPGFEGRVFTAVPPNVAGRVPASGPRTVRVTARRSPGPLAEPEAVLVDSLRRRLARTPGLVLAEGDAEPVNSGLGPEMVVTARLTSVGRDSVQARIDIIDPLAAPSFLHRVVRGPVTGAGEPLRDLTEVIGSAATTLTQMAKAPRGTTVWRIQPPEGTGQR
jgi:tRNA A-37 threonylcarbamoyl transferase component Bud32